MQPIIIIPLLLITAINVFAGEVCCSKEKLALEKARDEWVDFYKKVKESEDFLDNADMNYKAAKAEVKIIVYEMGRTDDYEELAKLFAQLLVAVGKRNAAWAKLQAAVKLNDAAITWYQRLYDKAMAAAKRYESCIKNCPQNPEPKPKGPKKLF